MNLDRSGGWTAARSERRAPALRVDGFQVRAEPDFRVPGAARCACSNRGFTLIEIMLVVAILGIVLAMGIPSIYHMMNKEAMIAAVRDVTDLCRNARARAVFKETTVELHINMRDGRLSLTGGGLAGGAEGSFTQTSAQFSDRIRVELLGVNFQDFTDADDAVVKFYQDGTSDELTIVLQSDRGEERKITLEVVTGLAQVDTLSYENRR